MENLQIADLPAENLLLADLPTDVLGLVLLRLDSRRRIARVAPVCISLRAAARVVEQALRRVCLEGHSSPVSCVAAVPDGRVITGSYDQTVMVWRDGACESIIQAQAGIVNAVAVLPGGARFVTGLRDAALLWTLDGNRQRTYLVETERNGTRVNCVAALPDGVHFVVGVGSWEFGEVRLYHVDGTLVHTFEGQIPVDEDEEWIPDVNGGHTDIVNAVAVTPDGQHIISGSQDNLVKVWSVASKSLVSTCGVGCDNEDDAVGHTNAVFAVAAMPDGQRFLSGADDDTVRVWLLDGTLENTFKLHNHLVTALVALPDNQHALSGSLDQTVKLFNVNDGAVVRTFKHHASGVKCLALLPDGLRFVSGSADNDARIVEIGPLP